MKQIFCNISGLALLALAACGQGAESDAGASQAQTPEESPAGMATKADGLEDARLAQSSRDDGPEIGERVPEPDDSAAGAADNSLAAAGAKAKAKAEALKARGVTEIGWEELMPAGEEERIAELYQARMARMYSQGGAVAEGSARDQAVQIGTFNTVAEINGKPADGLKIRLPGYTVPFEYGSDAAISEFLLVPYYGACLHAPPPPPNQTVFVSTEEKIKLKDLSQAVWIEGTLRTRTETSDLADAAYVIEMTDWEIYEY